MDEQQPTPSLTDTCNSTTVKVGATTNCNNDTTEIESPGCTPTKIFQKSGESGSITHRVTKSAICERVKVIVRCRPMSPKEIQEKCESIVTVNLEIKSVQIQAPKFSKIRSPAPPAQNLEIKAFSFDAVYDSSLTQRQLYEESFRPLVDSVLEGFNGTIFAYGQTGTGKTYTMEGKRGDELHQGVIPNSFRHIFQHISAHYSENKQYLIQASYLEIYQEEIRDLLCDKDKNHLELRESPTSGVYVKGLTSRLCGSFEEIEDLMARGNKNRSVGATNMNEHSSRSHAIFTITVDMSETLSSDKTLFKVGKLNLVDLAGSERQAKTGATGERLKEASKINLSLSALGNVIAALVDDKATHIPYRDSKLTRLLQDSLGGNSKTVMVATIGPACSNRDETITTLRYANRAKNIQNKPKVNEDPKDALLREYQEEIVNLRIELERRKSKKVEQIPPTAEEKSKSKGMGDSKDIPQTVDVSLKDKNSVGDQRASQLAALVEPYGIDPTLPPHVIMEKLAEIRKALVEDKMQVKNEKDDLLLQLDNTTNFLKHTQKECSQLVARISWLESKVFTGGKGKDLILHTEEQAKYLEATQMELSQHFERYAEMEKKFQEEKFSIEHLKSQSAEAEMEFYNKSRKYDKVCRRLQSTRDKVKAKQDKRIVEIEDLQTIQNELKKEFTLKKMIIDNFIPRMSRKELEKRMVWDKDADCYKVTADTPVSIEEINPPIDRSTHIPMYNISETGVMHKLDKVHFTNENLLQLHPEVPKRKTKDYIPPSTDPRVTSLMNKAFQDLEKNLVIDCGPNAKSCGIKRSPLVEQKECFTIGETVIRRVTPVSYASNAGDHSKSTHFFDFSVISSHRSSKVDQRLLTQYILDSLSPDA